ncbi:MAG TPA: hypothetical protein V6D12_03150 [Candidatus Obscuribacterales bacterium]
MRSYSQQSDRNSLLIPLMTLTHLSGSLEQSSFARLPSKDTQIHLTQTI